jgi:hypothetical protein
MRNLRTAAALVVLALAFSLAAPAVAGDVPRHAQAPSGVLESLRSLVTRLFSATPTVNTAEGCRIDPWGNCLPHTDAGCRIDPLGACLPDH